MDLIWIIICLQKLRSKRFYIIKNERNNLKVWWTIALINTFSNLDWKREMKVKREVEEKKNVAGWKVYFSILGTPMRIK